VEGKMKDFTKQLISNEGLNISSFTKKELRKLLKSVLCNEYRNSYFDGDIENTSGGVYSYIYVKGPRLYLCAADYYSFREKEGGINFYYETHGWGSKGSGCSLCKRTKEGWVTWLCDKCIAKEVDDIIDKFYEKNGHLDEMVEEIYQFA